MSFFDCIPKFSIHLFRSFPIFDIRRHGNLSTLHPALRLPVGFALVHTPPMQIVSKRMLLVLFSLFSTLPPTIAGNWPQFLGPQRNGVATDESSVKDWKKTPPERLWRLEIGSGFSSPIVKDSRIYLYHRKNDQNILDCMDLKTGKEVWKYQHTTQYRDDFGFDPGPRATPCLHEEAIYLMSADGILTCVNATNGQRIWEVNAREEWDTDKGFFGRAPSPLVYEDSVIYIIGGKLNAGVIALDQVTGQLQWKATSDPAGYASPVLDRHASPPILWTWTRERIYGINPDDGKIRFSRPLRSSMNASVNAATPLVLPEGLFLSAGYGVGGNLLEISNDSLQLKWAGDKQMSNHYATCVYEDGYLYGFHGRQEFGPEFRCIEASTGNVQWTEKNLGAGSVIRVNQQLFIMLESGELIMAGADSTQFKVIARKQILPSGVRSFPAYSNGHFIARSPDQMVCWKFEN